MRRSLERFILAGIVGLAAACTAIVTAEPVQCQNDGDCTKRGPDFVDTMCNADRLCVAKPLVAPTPVVDSGPPPECAKNSDCASKGAGFVCSSNIHKCTQIEADGCSVVYGDATADGTILYGLLSEIGRDDTNYFRQLPYVSAAKLAFSEFFDRAGVKFPGDVKGALIACSEYRPRKVSAHLANLGVKAIIGPSSEERQKAVVETLLPAKIPSFTPWMNGNPASVVQGSTGFAWLAGFQRSDVVGPLNALIEERQVDIRTPTKPKIRVAVVVNEAVPPAFNAYLEYGELMDQRLRFNDKTAVENQNDLTCDGPCYKRFVTNQAPLATVTERAIAIAAFKPDIIIPFTDIDWGAQLLPALETEFAKVPEAERPLYVQAFLQIEDAGYTQLNAGDPKLRKRITGIRPLRDNSFEVFVNKFRAAYAPPDAGAVLGPPPNPGAGRAFETSLLLLLTTYAALVEKPNATPEEIVAALPKTTDSKATRITLNDLVAGVAQLNAKAPINFDGLFTFFDLDLTSHSSPATWTTWCLANDATYVSPPGRVYKAPIFEGTASLCP